MMDRYTFRGKNINGVWAHGRLSESTGKHGLPEKGMYISNSAGMPWAYNVRPETIGQCVGERANESCRGESEADLMVYEHDFVTVTWYTHEEPSSCVTGEIVWSKGDNAWVIWDEENKAIHEFSEQGMYCWEVVIIGNRWDNPELLEAQR